jgi:hypothetical protein
MHASTIRRSQRAFMHGSREGRYGFRVTPLIGGGLRLARLAARGGRDATAPTHR